MTGTMQETMPVVLSNEGVWEGWYRYYDADGNKIDEHRSRLLCRLTNEPGREYHQTNYYFWDDGRTDTRDFPGVYRDGRIWFKNDLIDGWVADQKPDDLNRSSLLFWTRQNEPGVTLYEMIQNSDCRTHRARTWQWFKDGVLFQRTLINERLVTRDWRNWTDFTSVPNVK